MNTKLNKFIIKFKFNVNSTSLNQKVSTILGQRRMNSSEIFNILVSKIDMLKIKKDTDLILNIWIIVFDLDDYVLYIKLPSLTDLVNRVLSVNKNSRTPGYLFNIKLKRGTFNLILTPYLLYEVVLYKYKYQNISNLSFYSYYKKHISSLRSKGIHMNVK